MQEQTQAANWFVQFLTDNWVWIAPIIFAIILGILDIIFHKLPGPWKSKLKPAYDLIMAKLKRK